MKNLTLLIILAFLLSLFTAIAAPQPGLCYFGDSNGDCVINFIDLKTAQNAAMQRPADYSGVTPSSPDVQDLNGDGIISSMDVLLIRDLMMSKIANIIGKPTQIMILQAPSQLDITLPTDTIKVNVIDADGTPRAGIGVRFTVDDSSIATLGGRDPSNGDNYITNSDSVFELTDTIAQNGEAQIAITPLAIGTLTVNMVIPADPSKGVLNDITNSLTINVVSGGGTILNNAPVFNPIDSITTYSNQQVQFAVSATDGNSDPLIYSLVSGPGSFNPATQTYTWTPTQADKTRTFTTYNLLFRVTDGMATTQASTTVTIVNRVPVIQDIADITVDENGLVSVTPVVNDEDNDDVDVSYSSLLDSNGEWQTDYNSAGVYSITVIATDGINSASKTFNINVNDKTQNNNDQGENSGGGHSYEPKECVSTPTGKTEIKGDVKIVYVEDSCTGEVTSYEENLPKPKVQPINPVEPENNAEQNVNAQGNQATGFAIVGDLVKKNPAISAILALIILGLMIYGYRWIRKK